METTECAFDELLCQSLLLFRQSRFYDRCQESEIEAYQLLEKAESIMSRTKGYVEMAKWGCALECLSQKYYIDSDTDRFLEAVDVTLISFWKKTEVSYPDIHVYLWLGYYFLLRIKNSHSGCRTRCKQMMFELLSYLIEFIREFNKKPVPIDISSSFSVTVWGETVYWAEQVHNSCFCEKQSATLLHQLYDLRKMDLPQNEVKKDVLLQHILDFYCF